MFCSVRFIVAHVHESAVHGTRVTFGLPCRVNNSHQTASKLLQDHALCCSFRLAHLLRLLCLCKKAFARGISYLLGNKCKGQPEKYQNTTKIHSVPAKTHNTPNSRAGQLFSTRTHEISSLLLLPSAFRQLQSSELVGHCALMPASIHVHLEVDSEIPRYIEQFSSFYSKGSSRITSSQ